MSELLKRQEEIDKDPLLIIKNFELEFSINE